MNSPAKRPTWQGLRGGLPLWPMLRTIHFQGYRSLRDFCLRLGRVTVVTGENGVGKSNVYRALGLMRKMAEGRFAADGWATSAASEVSAAMANVVFVFMTTDDCHARKPLSVKAL